jgi:hypothetical protein
MAFPTDDLRYAQTVQLAVDISLVNGEKFFTGVHDVDEEQGFVAFYNPQTFGDSTTTRKVALDLVASVTVTNIDYTTGEAPSSPVELGPGELSVLRAVHALTAAVGNVSGGDLVSITTWMQDNAQDDPRPGTVPVQHLIVGLVDKGLLVEVRDPKSVIFCWGLTEDGNAALAESET